MSARDQAAPTHELVARRLQGGGIDWRGAVLEGFLLLGLPPMAAAGLLLAAWWPRKKHEARGAL